MSRSSSRLAPWLIVAVVGSIAPVLSQDEGGQTPPPAPDKKDAPDRRNPRQIRRDEGQNDGPRMVAGGISLLGDGLDSYKNLEPLIGDFIIAGKNWQRPDADPFDTEGTWTNSWDMDGWYIRCEFEITTGRPYRVLGLMCFDMQDNQWEADFFNSAGTNRSRRFGTFDETGKILTLMSRSSSQTENEPPQQKVVIEIVSDDRFTYTGWVLNRETEVWWRNYEIVATRVGAETTEAAGVETAAGTASDSAGNDADDDADDGGG